MNQTLSRGLLVCPACLSQAMVRTDTMTTDIPAEAGAVVREQVYRCTTPQCDAIVRIRHVSEGLVTKTTLRAGSHCRQ